MTNPIPGVIELQPGTRPGYVQILFPWKPATEETNALKKAGFRYTAKVGAPRWYGRIEKAPAEYRTGIQALLTLTESAVRS